MSVQIRRIEADEIRIFIHLLRTSLYEGGDIINHFMFPSGPTSALVDWQTARYVKRISEEDPEVHMFLAGFPKPGDTDAKPADPEGKDMLSVAYWQLEGPSTFKPEDLEWEPTIPTGPFPERPVSSPHAPMDESVPPDSRPEVIRYFIKYINRMRQRLMGKDQTYWHLQLLATRTDHWRRGAGRALLEWGLNQADKAGMRAYLDATEMGRPFYERFGFRVMDVVRMDSADWHIPGDQIGYTYGMVREPDGVVPPAEEKAVAQ